MAPDRQSEGGEPKRRRLRSSSPPGQGRSDARESTSGRAHDKHKRRRSRSNDANNEDMGRKGRKGKDGSGKKRRDSRSRSPQRDAIKDRSGRPRERSPPRGPRASNRDRDGRDGGMKAPTGPRARHEGSGRQARRPDAAMLDAMVIDVENATEEEVTAALSKAMGFNAFKTTKESKVPGNDKLYGVRKEKKTEYRQYMNRTGGFNRPLSPSR